MPVLNTAAYLPDAIDSILGQTFGDLELIIADDGSSDASREIAASYARLDRRVRTLALQRDPSLTSGARAANAAVDAARGDYIARMDSDDIAAPDRLAVQLAHMQVRDLDICGGKCAMLGDPGRVEAHPESQDGILNELVFRSACVLSSLMLRAPLMREARFGLAESFEQYEFQTRIVFLGRWENVPGVVHHFRKHAASATHVFHQQKADSNWRLRFGYFFRRFPEATLEDFQVIHRIARAIPIETSDALATAARWLERLSRVDEAAVRAGMAKRWREVCDGARLDEAAIAALREPVAARIAAAP
jgi:glycosyltransferase involved in cell wall biosynthesis